jgi:hypothetical protein
MAEKTTELAHILRRAKRRCQYPIAMELLPPSTIEAIGFRTARHVLGVACIDESDLEASGLEALKQWEPVYSRRFHDDRGAPTGGQPIGQTMQVTGKGTKFLNRVGIAIGGDAAPMLLSPYIDAGGMWVDEGHRLGRGRVLLAFFRQTFLQSGAER